MDSGYDADLSDNEDLCDLRPKKRQLKPRSFFMIPRLREYFNGDGILRHYIINGPVVHSSGSESPQPGELGNSSDDTSSTSTDSSKLGKKRKHADCNDKSADKNKKPDDDEESPKHPRYNCVPYFWFSNCVTPQTERNMEIDN